MPTRSGATSTSSAGASERLIVAALVLLALARIVATYHVFSQTADEPTHVAAGLEWWRDHRYDLDAEHPPLARILIAIEPYLTGATVPEHWDRVAAGNLVLHRNDRYRKNLERVRAANLPFLVIALLSVWGFTRRIFDRTTAFAALALAGAMPPILGHAGLATTDMAPTALVIAAAAAFALWLGEPNWRNATLLAVAVATGVITKFSFPVFFAIAAASSLFARRTSAWKKRAAQLIVVIFAAMVAVAAAYRFDFGAINDVRPQVFLPASGEAIAARYARVPGYSWVRVDLMNRFWDYARANPKVDFVDWAKAAGYPSPLAGRHGNTMAGAPPIARPSIADRVLEPFRARYQWFATHVPVFAPKFFAGAELVSWHARTGHPAYLLGRFSWTGWWYYFPVVFFFKTPLAFIALALIGIVIAVRVQGAARAIAIAPLLMFVPAMTSKINIGVRHILPLYPFFCIAAAAGAVAMWRSRRTIARVSAGVLLAWYFVATAIAHPDYLAYFNELAGSHPERIALDSNLDWGQDLFRLASAVAKRRIPHLYVAYFGNEEWKRTLPEGDELPPMTPVDGWVAISEMRIVSDDYAWLRKYTPVQQVGKSIRLYFVNFRDSHARPPRRTDRDPPSGGVPRS